LCQRVVLRPHPGRVLIPLIIALFRLAHRIYPLRSLAAAAIETVGQS
jgi:hypothetical protein